ncbi:MAG: integrase arm-type DNA-binding domain-containing protein [Magnetococcales bacterium]|nr:integrase arm-type DNA-binding domain-containing protein [Magnetococcales bacterium]
MLTDILVRNAKPSEKAYKISDGRGMYLLVTPAGGKLWRFDCRFDGKRKTLAMGGYPDVSLKRARKRLDEARQLLAEGIDPTRGRGDVLEAVSRTLGAVTREWFAKQEPSWARGHADRIIQRLERDVLSWLGDRQVDTVTAPEVLTVLRRIEERGAVETAHRAMQNVGQIFRYAIATGRAERNPAADLKGALSPIAEGHHPALIDSQRVGGLLRALDGYHGHITVKQILLLHPYVFTRPGELRMARWEEMDIEAALWTIPSTRMKTRSDHMVPLSRQALAILGVMRSSSKGEFVFPTPRDQGRPLSDMATSVAYKAMGFSGIHTPHGWRATARTLLDEALGYPPHLIEHQLAHVVRDPLGRAYNRTSHLPERRQMMQAWADYLAACRISNPPPLVF